jgi:membrane protein required for colicin V production
MDIDLHLSLLDFLIVVVLSWSVYKGYLQGFIVHSIALFALLVGTYLAAKLSMVFYSMIVDDAAVPLPNLPVVIFGLLFALVLYGTNYTAMYVLRQVASIPLNPYTKLLGAFFGAVKYLFIISVIFVFVARLDKSYGMVTETEHKRTKLYGPVSKIAPAIIPRLKFEIKEPGLIELENIDIVED